MSEWKEIKNKEDVELSEDGKHIEVLYTSDEFGNKYLEIPVEFVVEALNTRATQSAEAPDLCPDCGRKKAKNARDMANGLCPKWYAITDEAAEQDCKNNEIPPGASWDERGSVPPELF